MKARQIIFIAPMVRAILECRKTQTRQVIKPQPSTVDEHGLWYRMPSGGESLNCYPCPYGKPGDRLWVAETWNCIGTGITAQRQDWVRYRATDGEEMYWRPSIFMPRWASRITIEIVSVRIEQVQDIREADVLAEGVPQYTLARGAMSEPQTDSRWKFIELWNSINGDQGYGWDANPWVWAIEFRRFIEGHIA